MTLRLITGDWNQHIVPYQADRLIGIALTKEKYTKNKERTSEAEMIFMNAMRGRNMRILNTYDAWWKVVDIQEGVDDIDEATKTKKHDSNDDTMQEHQLNNDEVAPGLFTTPRKAEGPTNPGGLCSRCARRSRDGFTTPLKIQRFTNTALLGRRCTTRSQNGCTTPTKTTRHTSTRSTCRQRARWAQDGIAPTTRHAADAGDKNGDLPGPFHHAEKHISSPTRRTPPLAAHNDTSPRRTLLSQTMCEKGTGRIHHAEKCVTAQEQGMPLPTMCRTIPGRFHHAEESAGTPPHGTPAGRKGPPPPADKDEQRDIPGRFYHAEENIQHSDRHPPGEHSTLPHTSTRFYDAHSS